MSSKKIKKGPPPPPSLLSNIFAFRSEEEEKNKQILFFGMIFLLDFDFNRRLLIEILNYQTTLDKYIFVP